jgi:nicotinamide-nucleotide amidase
MFDLETLELAQRTLAHLRRSGIMIVTAESCTGGLIAGALTAIAGSSDCVYGSFVTYAYAAKTAMIGVDPTLLSETGPGAVSEEVARAMARGALAAAQAGDPRVAVAVAVTGVAGPEGSEAKPVGLVHFALALAIDGDLPKIHHAVHRFDAALGRQGIRAATVNTALELVLNLV